MKLKFLNSVLFIGVLQSCASSVGTSKSAESVSVTTAIEMARNSYLLGCVTGIKHLNGDKKTYGKVFEFCRDGSQKHKDSLKSMISD
jgi:hypothetical protein